MIVGLAAFVRALVQPMALLNDPDTYLHIAAGRWMATHLALPVHDPFSHSLAGARWVPHEWLAEIILSLVYSAVGWSGLVLVGAACFAAGMALLNVSVVPWLGPVLLAAVAARLVGALGGGGGGPLGAALKATICITHASAPPSGAVESYEPATVTVRSSAMSPSGLVITRDVQPEPAPVVQLLTVLAAKSKSDALVVAAAGVLLVALLPVADAVASTGLTGSSPTYSRMRTSAKSAGTVNETLTALAAAAAAPMLIA